jgi:hypothetical protein
MRQLTLPTIFILVLCSLNINAEAANEWYVVLGSFPQNDKGLKAANQLRERFNTIDFNQDNLIVGESNFYSGLTGGLYVVMCGPFYERQTAMNWANKKSVRSIVKDVYIKQAQARQD